MKHMQILVIRPGAIGDVLLTFPVLQKLRKEYTNPHITLVSNAVVLPLALASEIVDQAFDYEDMLWSELFAETGIKTPSLQDLLAQIDLAICWLRDPDHVVEQNLRKAGIKQVIVAPGRPPEGKQIHIVNYLAGTLGLPVSQGTLDGGAIDGVLPLQRIAIHPGSGSPAKCWPIQYFAQVIERLWQQNRPVLLLAGPADVERLETLRTQLSLPSKPELLQVLTNSPLLEVAHHLQDCRCYLGNDAGITHLAAMLGIPTVAIFGPSDPAIWHPIGPTVKVVQGHTLEQVTVDLVMEAINSFYIDRKMQIYGPEVP
jgi:heptosyltransferase III